MEDIYYSLICRPKISTMVLATLKKHRISIRIFGLVVLMAYVSVILALWVYADLSGYVYFRGGEPLWWLRYSEWAMGLVGLGVAGEYLLREVGLADREESKDF